jgi:SRP54-type protein, GTPase domain
MLMHVDFKGTLLFCSMLTSGLHVLLLCNDYTCVLDTAGKSTSLAKVAYYLKQNGVDVMLAACDTYRSVDLPQHRLALSTLH